MYTNSLQSGVKYILYFVLGLLTAFFINTSLTFADDEVQAVAPEVILSETFDVSGTNSGALIVSEESNVEEGELIVDTFDGVVFEETESYVEEATSDVSGEDSGDAATETVTSVQVDETASAQTGNSPELSTDKSNYMPGETATLFGRFFSPLKSFVVKIFGSDEHDEQYTETETEVTTDASGVFSLSYVLDSVYRPFYDVVVTLKETGEKVADTWFRDAAVGAYDQCANDAGEGYGTPGVCNWTNGNLNAQNSTYIEGDSTVQRLWLTGLEPDTVNTVTLQYGKTKQGKRAYDFLTSWDASESWIQVSDLCSGIPGCGAGSPDVLGIPSDPEGNTALFEALVTKRDFTMYGGDLMSATAPVTSGSLTGDSEAEITITFRTPASGDMCSMKGRVTSCGVALFFGAHVARTADWSQFGTTGAGTISGSPYHVALLALNGASIGSRDNQMQSNALPSTIQVTKVTSDESTTTVFPFTVTGVGYQAFSLTHGDTNTQYLRPKNNQKTYTVSESLVSDWKLTDLKCTTNNTASSVSTSLVLRTATIELDTQSSSHIECTFTNTKDVPAPIAVLTLVKEVNNDHGGTAGVGDWTLTAGGVTPLSGISGSPAVTAVPVVPGEYTLGETGSVDGYTASPYSCVMNNGAPVLGNTLTLIDKDTAVCTIVNDDQPASISGMKFEDMNGNGVKDVGEPGLQGWTISIDGPVDQSTVTGTDGTYSFTNLPQGTYTVTETNQVGWKQTTANPAPITLANGESATDVNFGNFKLVSITGKKFSDLDGDGAARETGEPYLQGWTMRLYDTATNPWTLVDTQVTDSTGSYTFGNLSMGSYKVCEVLQSGWVQTFPKTGSNTSPNSSEEGVRCITRNIESSGDPQDAANFGNYEAKALTVAKTANTTFTRTFGWTIDKSVTPTTINLFKGSSADVTYTVAVTKDNGTDSAWAVSGTITITNPNPLSTGLTASIASVTDTMTGGVNATVNCPETSIAAGSSMVCTYSAGLPDGTDRTNTATVVTTGMVGGGTADAAVTFGAPTTKVHDSVTVTDTYSGAGAPWNFGGNGSQTYTRTFTCDADEGVKENTATISETGQNDSASVTVNCHDLTVTKTADTAYTRTFDWTIDKSVDQSTLDMFTNDSKTVNYTVSVTKDGGTDSNRTVSGTITITNPAPMDASLTGVTESISGATVQCPSTTVPAGGSLVCTYSAALGSSESFTNTAIAELTNGTTYSGTAPVVFDLENPTVKVHDSVAVKDVFGIEPANVLGTTDVSMTFTYTRSFTCNADDNKWNNIASVHGDNGVKLDGAEAMITVNCYDLEVSKTANTSLTRTYSWDIDKKGATSTLTLKPDQVHPVDYTVTVTNLGPIDSAWAVAGIITVQNPAPIDATITGVSDMVSGNVAATVDCDVNFPYTLKAGETLTCSYTAPLSDATERTNTAVATLDNTGDSTTDFSGTAAVSFADPTVNEVDECVAVTDDKKGVLGTVCKDDSPKSFPYTLDISYPDTSCGLTEQYVNTATLTTNDQGITDSDAWTVAVTVKCACTLTQGYWKTHSDKGKAPYDPAWGNIGDFDGDRVIEEEDETFYSAMNTWYGTFWTPVKGNVYYQLAHQYMAAKLNVLNGASAPQNVKDALTQAELLFSSKTPAQMSKVKGAEKNTWTKLAGTLGSYNEGLIGPGHCSELKESQY